MQRYIKQFLDKIDSVNKFIITIIFALFVMLCPHSLFAKEPHLVKIKGVYEPSGVTQIGDGRLLVVEDEPTHAFSILKLNKYGKLVTNSAVNAKLIKDFKRKIDDLEGVTNDEKGYIYAITSHSKTKKGKLKKSRMQLLRFQIIGDSAKEIVSFKKLIQSLNDDKNLQNSIKTQMGRGMDFSDINIEGLEYYPKKKELLLAFRNPVVNGYSMIIPIDNPKEIFENKKKATFGKAIFLDLNGGGIRSIDYDKDDDKFIIANETKDRNGKHRANLWSWDKKSEKVQKMDLPKGLDLKNIEAIDSIMTNTDKMLLLMSDSGNAKKSKNAKYILLKSTKKRR